MHPITPSDFMRNVFLMTLLCVLFVACSTVKSFERMDRNVDGRIDRDEAAAAPKVAEMFSSADDDDSETLDPAEYESVLTIIDRYRQSTPRRSGGRGNVDVGH
jgi:hypothetical protein